ncbi:hypothetical protein EKO29_14570 [Colwellia sp. Arc7-635]|jgi:hypothetical protein|uniref:hypothetical protein n=1 Tax=Colwellia sp. Arc7-635 TaxID=2497879 RepID=UPI000F857347|nr:hypothetical protein [Colwellia sp. Arc7-635]AZQ85097.1 hypothetical protein EKO29_14570 [Colwellia sp. Arc7-635]
MNEERTDSWIMAPHMVETAYKYYRAAQLLWSTDFQISIVNAALSIEILFKSFNAEIVANDGKINEKYRFNDKILPKKSNKHDLMVLYNALPDDVKSLFHDNFTLDILEKYRRTFVEDRYMYEDGARSGATGAIIDIAGKLILMTVNLYRERSNNDPWITNYPNV